MNSKDILLAMQALSLHMRQTNREPDRQPFPFLKLPKELRLIIYEYLAHLHRHDNISVPVGRNRTTVTLVTPVPIPSIHLTCRLVHSEASPFLRKRLQQTTRTIPRIIIPAAHAMRLAKYDGLIDEILNWLHQVRFTKHLLPSNDMKEELEARFPSIGPNPTFAAASIARLANVGGVHVNALSEKLARFEWDRFRWSECKTLMKLAKEREVALGRSDAQLALHVLVRDEIEVDMEALRKRLGVRGRDCRIHIVVYRAHRDGREDGHDTSYPTWVTDGSVITGRQWLEDWA